MKALKRSLPTLVCMLLGPPVFAAGPAPSPASVASPGRAGDTGPVIDRYALRCQGRAPQRDIRTQGTALWGTKLSWDSEQVTDERRSVLTSIDGEAVRKTETGVRAVRLEEGRLVASPDAAADVVGTVLQGTDSEGHPVEVALCAAEPSADDPSVTWYRLEAWNAVAQEWEDPCLGNALAPSPRALAVGGVWDSTGARREVPGRLTLACETGAISKCIGMGYKPWAEREGKSLADLHQACTRMARADYCGDGRSHTLSGTLIDIYDVFGVLERTTQSSASWNPADASFEAAWAPDGAACLARTRYGQSLESLMQECPGRFRAEAVDFKDGDRCTVGRQNVTPGTVLLRNRSYGRP